MYYVGPTKKDIYSQPVYEQKIFNCPECYEKAVKTCNCVNSDKTCVNGHVWYMNREGAIVLGDPHAKKK